MSSTPSAVGAPLAALEQWVEQWCAGVEVEPRLIVTRGAGAHVDRLASRFPSAMIVSWTRADSFRKNRTYLETSRERLGVVMIRALSLGVEVYTANPPQAVLEGPPTFGDFEFLILELRREALMEMGTTKKLGRLFLDNLSENLDDLLDDSISIAHVHGLIGDRPVLVVGAGPSLGPFAAELAGWRERVFIIAATSALRPLHEVGIVPDMAVIIEPRECLHHFDGIPEDVVSRLTLVVESSTHPSHLRLPVARRIHFHGAAGHWLAPLSGDGSCVPTGGNVGTTMLVIAWMLGGWPILIAGLDFAVSGDRYYTDKCGSRHERVPEEAVEPVAGWGYRMLRATPELISYRAQSENVIETIRKRDARARFLMLTLDGARIEGVTPVEWRPLARELPRLESAAVLGRLEALPRGIDGSRAPVVEKRLERLLAEIDAMLDDDDGLFEGFVLSRSMHKLLEMLIVPPILERRERGQFGEPTKAEIDSAREWILQMRERIRRYLDARCGDARISARASSAP